MEDVKLFDQKTYYSEYMDDLNYSQGFYVTPSKDGSVVLGGIRRVGDCSDDRYLKAERAAKFAVAEHNNKSGKEGFLKFDKIVNLNVEPSAGSIFYITAAVVDADGEACLYQIKIWEKLNTGYKVHIFRPAPYSLKVSEKPGNCCVAIHNLMPWMDENYLYYKCFRAKPEIVGVEAVCNGSEQTTAYVWFRNSAQKEVIMNKYKGRKMPHSDVSYAFDLTTC